jgi:curved DNA-binding protein CbpA
MAHDSSLFDRIRIKPPLPEDKPAERGCDHPGCARPGAYRAPMGRNREGRYFHFCLEHVQAYNKSYNYFNGMSDEAVAAFQKDAITGHRPTWTMGANATATPEAAESIADPLGLFRFRNGRATTHQAREEARRISVQSARALEKLGLDQTASKEEVRTRFKALAKRFHPDLNGGDRSMEEKLRSIIDAYNYLKTTGLA